MKAASTPTPLWTSPFRGTEPGTCKAFCELRLCALLESWGAGASSLRRTGYGARYTRRLPRGRSHASRRLLSWRNAACADGVTAMCRRISESVCTGCQPRERPTTHSPKFVVASDPSIATASIPQRHGGPVLVPNWGHYVSFVVALTPSNPRSELLEGPVPPRRRGLLLSADVFGP